MRPEVRFHPAALIAALRGRWRALFDRDALERDLDEEIRFHLELETAKNLAAGMTPNEARRAALHAFGGVDRMVEAHRDSRTSRLGNSVGDLVRDTRFAVRVLLRARSFSLVAVVILAIGMGASITMFSALYGVVLRPLPWDSPERLVVAWEARRENPEERSGVSAVMFRTLREQASFSSVAAYRPWGYELGGDGEPERLRGARVSANLFTLLGISTVIGRPFAAGEDSPGANAVVLLSEELWRRRFGADPSVLGARIELNGEPYDIIGVVPAGFVLPQADIWVPLILAAYEFEQRGNRALSIVARLGAGVRLETAKAEVGAVARRLADEDPVAHGGWDVGVDGLQRELAAGARAPLAILFTATCLVLLAACANLASLTLGRSLGRRREIAVRAALGAGRWRIVRMLVLESLTLVAAAAGLGLLFAAAGNGALVAVAGTWLPPGVEIGIAPMVAGFVVLIALAAALALAAIPAFEAARLDLYHVIRIAPRGIARGRIGLRDMTTVAQVALALVLLVGGGLLIRSFVNAQRTDLGFSVRDVTAMTVSLPERYGPQERVAFFAALEERAGALPRVSAVGLTSHVPLVGGALRTDFEIEGMSAPVAGVMTAQLMNVTRGYFDALRIPLLAGRGFAPTDRADGAPVVVIDAELAQRFWPNGHAVGAHIRLGATLGADTAWREVVGIAGAVRAASLERAPEPTLYIPYARNPWPSMSLVVAASGPPDAIGKEVAATVRTLDPSRPVYNVRSIDEAVSRLLAPRRMQTLLMGGFALATLMLAATGVYGMLANAVTQRTRELAIRIAMGARRSEIVRLCLERALFRVGAGLALGMAAALAGTRLLTGLLFGIRSWDPLTYGGAVILVLACGVAASVVPALRAARLNPVTALRHE